MEPSSAVTFEDGAGASAEEARPRIDSLSSISTLRTRKDSAPAEPTGGATADLPDRRSKEGVCFDLVWVNVKIDVQRALYYLC